jgi:hypothetical protein
MEVARLADKGDEVAPIIVIESIYERWPTIGVSRNDSYCKVANDWCTRNNDTKEILIAKWPTSV